MESIIILRDGEGLEVDLKISNDFLVSEFITIVKEIYNIKGHENQNIQVEPLGKILSKDRSLYEQGVKHGCILTLI